ITLGEYSMIGMASVVTKNVPPYALVFGSPARIKGYVCKCGHPLEFKGENGFCAKCSRKYSAKPSSNEQLAVQPA
ncbi:MAG: N-acetyltransferase, partial [Candidatus Omnitrophica bacterium]|nr:N-acetyltransferase [Candidatus Omnitrophota bacterium]